MLCYALIVLNVHSAWGKHLNCLASSLPDLCAALPTLRSLPTGVHA